MMTEAEVRQMVEDDRNKIADDIVKAAELINSAGLNQDGAYYNPMTNCFCVIGALVAVTKPVGVELEKYHYGSLENQNRVSRHKVFLEKFLIDQMEIPKPPDGTFVLVQWNDKIAENKNEVVDTLMDAARWIRGNKK